MQIDAQFKFPILQLDGSSHCASFGCCSFSKPQRLPRRMVGHSHYMNRCSPHRVGATLLMAPHASTFVAKSAAASHLCDMFTLHWALGPC